MSNLDLLRAADEALAMLRGMSDAEYLAMLESCEPTLAYAVNAQHRNFFYTSVMTSPLLAGYIIEGSLFFKLNQTLTGVLLNPQAAMNDSCYALAA